MKHTMTATRDGSGEAAARREALRTRVLRGVDHCRMAERLPVLVAFPEPVGSEVIASLATAGEDVIAAIVVCACDQPASGWDSSRVGTMLRNDYTWDLPAARARTVLYLGPRRIFTFRMARRALRHGIVMLVHTTPLGWKSEPLVLFVLRRIVEKLTHLTARAFYGVARSRPGRLVARMLMPLRIWLHRGSWFFGPVTRVGLKFTRLGQLRALLTAAHVPALSTHRFVAGRVVHYNSALAWGGAERQLVNTLLGASKLGAMDVSLVCEQVGTVSDHDFYLDHLQDAGVEVAELSRELEIPQTACEEATLERIAAALNRLPRSLADDVLFIARDLLQRRPFVVHAWQDSTCIKVGIAAVLVGVPRIVLSTRNLAPHRFPYWMPYMWAAYRALLECDNVVLINNSVAGARDYARWIGVPPERVQVVLNGFSAARFKRSSPQEVAAYRRKIGIPDGMRVVGSVFRFYAEKDPMLWMRAASKIARAHPDVVFLVLGTGPMQATMLRQMRRLGLEGRLWLPGTDKNPARMLSALDVFMLTSKMEGTPNVIIEAQMLGVPVVCTDAGGSAECVEDGVTGWVVRNRNAALLARRVSEILGDDAWREHAISHAPRFAGERFALQRMLNETFELYCSPQTNARSSGWFDAVVTGG